MKFKEADFYYGAVLSLLFNNGIDPALVEMFFASTFSLFLQTPSAAATQGNLRVIFH